ncbi:hypothetical protein CHAB381_0569 [Campylobacter hominis ATCC BAA-381]|uniref:Uncharacterized protein n=1 Tax=Campylobacter hominis (strain ATCC BAA-381 / DSM 21671 / CCUG 45161 / LMG 19568 / NCTC 13146 / CH001A) TaxID=360107 RepID=A7I0W6_CAMHC|nr:hypothetical protein CHAB381_0569 [Campylobacter hominis ATCC BAA-381]
MKQHKILFLIEIIEFVFISLILFLTLKILVPRDIHKFQLKYFIK